MYIENTAQAQTVFRLACHLLQYPDTAWQDVMTECRQVTEDLNDKSLATPLMRFINNVVPSGIELLQETYVHTFDFGKKTNLYVTYARHGEQRERGPELLKIKQYYAENGWHMADDELADYLPLMLEFCSVAPLAPVKQLLCEHEPAIMDIRAQLMKINSLYVDIFDALQLAMDELDIRLIAEGGTLS